MGVNAILKDSGLIWRVHAAKSAKDNLGLAVVSLIPMLRYDIGEEYYQRASPSCKLNMSNAASSDSSRLA
jgi:hypothetical protein